MFHREIRNMFFIYFILISCFYQSSNCDNICRIYVFNESLETPKSNVNNQKVNNYSSLLKAISEINKCATSKNEIIFELQADFMILSSYQIDFYKAKNENINLDNYFLFSNVSSNIKKITIKCFNCTGENPTEIAIKDQKISFWVDREINFINLNFTGNDINLNFDATIHSYCYFSREGCCKKSNSCLIAKTYNNTKKDVFYKIALFHLEEEGNLKIMNTSFSFFENYLVNRSLCFQSLIYIRKITNLILFDKSNFHTFYFEKGIILMENSVLNLTFNKMRISNYGTKITYLGLKNSSFLNILYFSKVYLFNIIFENNYYEIFVNIDKSFLTIETLHINDQSMQNTTLFKMNNFSFLQLKHLLIYNSTFSSLILAQQHNSIIVINLNLKNVSFINSYTIFLNNSNVFVAKSVFVYEVYNTKYQLFLNLGNSAIFYENFYILISSIFDPADYKRGLLHFNYSNNIFFIKCYFSQIKDSNNSWLYFTKVNTVIIKNCIFSNGYFEKYCGILSVPFNFDEFKSLIILKKNIIININSTNFNGFQISDAQIIFFENIYFNLNSMVTHCSAISRGTIFMKNERFYKIGLSTIAEKIYFFSFTTVLIIILNCTVFDSGSRYTYFIHTLSLSEILFNTITFVNSEIRLLHMTMRNIILIMNTLFKSMKLNFNELIYFPPAENDPNYIIIKDCYFFIFSGNYFNFDASNFLLINVVFESERLNESNIFFQRPMFEFSDSSIIKIKNNTFINNFAIFSIGTNNTFIVLNSKVINLNQKNVLKLFVDADYSNKMILSRLTIIGTRSSQINKGIIVLNKKNIIAITNNYISLHWIKKNEGIFSLIFVNIFNSIILKNINIQLEGFLYFFSCLMKNFVVTFDLDFKTYKINFNTLFSIISSEFLIKNAKIENLICSLFESIKSNIKMSHVVAKNISNGFGIVKQGNVKIFKFKFIAKSNRFPTFFHFLASVVYLYKIEVAELDLFSNSSFFKIESSHFCINASFIWMAKTLDDNSSIFSVTGKSDFFYIKKCDFSFNLATIFKFYYFQTEICLISLINFRRNLDRSRSSMIIKNSQITFSFLKNHFILTILNENVLKLNNFFVYSVDSNLTIKMKINRGLESQINFNGFVFKANFEHEFKKKNIISNKNFMFYEKIYANAFFIDGLGKKEKNLYLKNLTLQENYQYCLAIIQIYDSIDQPVKDEMSNFLDIFKITNNIYKDEDIFAFRFDNIGGSFCLKPNFKASFLFIQNKVLKYSISLRKSSNYPPLFLSIVFNRLCPSYQYLDTGGKCNYCPKNTFLKTLIENSDLEQKFPNIDCLPCSNQYGFFCFGDNKFTTLPNFWEIKGETSNIIKCPYKNICKGDNRNFKNEESFVFDDRYKAGFCFPNYKGILCLECEKTYGKWSDFECESCSSYLNYVNLGIQIVIKFLTQSIFILFLYKIKASFEKNDEFLLNQHLYQTLNIFIQVLNSLVSIEPNHFIYFRKTINFFVIFASNLDFPLAYECFFPDTDNKKFFFMISFRFFYFICLFVFIIFFLLKIKKKFNNSKEITLSFWKKFCCTIIVSLVFLFSYTSIEFFTKIFFCIDVKKNFKSIKIALYDPRMNCESSEYMHMLILSIIVLFFFACLNFAYSILVISKYQNYEIFSKFYQDRSNYINFLLISQSISPLIVNIFLNFFKYFSIFYYKYSVFLLNLIIVYQVLIFIITLKLRKNMISSFKDANSIELSLLLFSILFFSVFRIDLFESSSRNSKLFDLLFTFLLILLVTYYLFLKKLFNLLVIRVQEKYLSYYPTYDIAKKYFNFSEYKNYIKKLKSLQKVYCQKKYAMKKLFKIHKIENIVKSKKMGHNFIKGNIEDFFFQHKINFNSLKETQSKREIEFSSKAKFSFKIIKFSEKYYFFINNISESTLFWKTIDILSYKKCASKLAIRLTKKICFKDVSKERIDNFKFSLRLKNGWPDSRILLFLELENEKGDSILYCVLIHFNKTILQKTKRFILLKKD